MQTNKEAEQVTLSDLGICCGKMFQEPSPAELPKARTSVSSSKRLSELSAVPFMSLDLTPGHGNLLGESYWELISPWLGGAWMLNTGVSPNDARESSLSQILQDAPPIKYYLSPKACLGILRRASERGKALPPKLGRALKIQAGLMCADGTYGFECLSYQSAGRGYRPARCVRCLDGNHQYADADLRDAAG